MNKLILIVVIGMLTACTRPDNAVRILQEQGYTDIQITGYKWFACSKDDSTATGFMAKSANGMKIEGTVCSGWVFKNSTIRFD